VIDYSDRFGVNGLIRRLRRAELVLQLASDCEWDEVVYGTLTDDHPSNFDTAEPKSSITNHVGQLKLKTHGIKMKI